MGRDIILPICCLLGGLYQNSTRTATCWNKHWKWFHEALDSMQHLRLRNSMPSSLISSLSWLVGAFPGRAQKNLRRRGRYGSEPGPQSFTSKIAWLLVHVYHPTLLLLKSQFLLVEPCGTQFILGWTMSNLRLCWLIHQFCWLTPHASAAAKQRDGTARRRRAPVSRRWPWRKSPSLMERSCRDIFPDFVHTISTYIYMHNYMHIYIIHVI
jgi:hypothetical protein